MCLWVCALEPLVYLFIQEGGRYEELKVCHRTEPTGDSTSNLVIFTLDRKRMYEFF